jgi:hypothetical protein
LVALADAERSFGASSVQARELAEAVQYKLRGDRQSEPKTGKARAV